MRAVSAEAMGAEAVGAEALSANVAVRARCAVKKKAGCPEGQPALNQIF